MLHTEAKVFADNVSLSIQSSGPALLYHAQTVIDNPPGGNGNGRFDPGETGQLLVAVRNAGNQTAANTTARLRLCNPLLTAADSTASYGSIPAGAMRTNTSDPFLVQVDNSVLKETDVLCTLAISADGYSTKAGFVLKVGLITSTDPIPDGPERPARYWAYDEIDVGYVKKPDFSWFEIRSLGTRLNLNDDQTVQLNLPSGFVWRYYGQTYNQISVCGNGWIAPGYTFLSSCTNLKLPDTTMPAFVALNFDDLYPPLGGGIRYYHDAANHRFVVEFDSVHYVSPPEKWDKFQFILYDTTVTTPTGDNEFTVQYLTANNCHSNTVGIQDQTRMIALQCIYNDTCHRGTVPLGAGRAIKYTTAGPSAGPVKNVGVSKLIAPAGTIDSGTVLTPACSVYNYGTTTESYAVRMKVGSFYAQDVNVSAHAPGTRRYVAFPTWTASQTGTHAVGCSTRLAGDMGPANDKKAGSVTVRVRDVGITRLLSPAGTLDSGVVVTPACSVRNYGTLSESYDVQMRIGSAYSQTATVSSHSPGATVLVTFPNWTASQKGTHAVTCSTRLTGDSRTANDRVTGSVTVQKRDVGATKLISPSGTIDSGTVVVPACTVANTGTTTESYPVRIKLGTFYSQTATVAGHAPGTKRLVTFPAWSAVEKGSHAVTCSTELAGDARPDNDRQAGSVTVRVRDVGVSMLLSPVGTADSGSTVIPKARIANYGTSAETFTIRFWIEDPDQNGLPTGHLEPHPMAHTECRMPSAKYRVPNPTAGFARWSEGYYCERTRTVGPGTSDTVWFDPWIAELRGTHAVRCSTALTGDINSSNDRRTGIVTVRVRDVGVTKLIAPSGVVDSGTVTSPACSVHNFGTTAETYPVRMRIGTAYDETATVTNHAPGSHVYVTFPSWVAGPRGTHAVTCSTELAGDMRPANEKKSGDVNVRVRDVGVAQVLAPTGIVDSGTNVTPRVKLRNFGTGPESFWVWFRIERMWSSDRAAEWPSATVSLSLCPSLKRCSSPGPRVTTGSDDDYRDSAAVSGLAPGDSAFLTFSSWTPSEVGNFRAVSYSMLAGDVRQANDTARGLVSVRRPGRDVGATVILAPVGVIHDTATVVPRAEVKNFGSCLETFPVRFTIGDSAYVCDTNLTLAGGSLDTVEFAPWMPIPGSFATKCWTMLSGDQNRSNDTVSDSVVVLGTGVAAGPTKTPGFALDPANPNPFSGLTSIRYALPDRSQIELAIYDASGAAIRCLKSGPEEAGCHAAVWNGRDDAGRPVACGVYYCRLLAAGAHEVRKLVRSD